MEVKAVGSTSGAAAGVGGPDGVGDPAGTTGGPAGTTGDPAGTTGDPAGLTEAAGTMVPAGAAIGIIVDPSP